MAARFLPFVLMAFSMTALAQRNPVPLLNQPLLPTSIAPGSAKFTLTVNGTGFVSGATVKWNGSARTTQVISGSQVQATINASDVANAKTASITVANPSPGGGASNVVYFFVRNSSSTVTMARTDKQGAFPWGVVVADFNKDGKLDLVAGKKTTRTTGAIQLFLGKGDGTFKAPIDSKSSPPYGPRFAADFNNDGKLDLITVGFGSLAAFLANGRGGFVQKQSYQYCCKSAYVSVADFNGDGYLDLAVAEGGVQGYTSIGSWLGNGDGTFNAVWGQTPPFDGGGGPTIGDFNGDGKLDFALPDAYGYVDIYLGNGDGTFQNPVSYKGAYGSGPYVITADVNGDGKLDLLTSKGSVLLGNGDGTFTPTGGISTGFSHFYNLFVGDFNGDGVLDVVGRSDTGSVDIFLGNGDGTFQTAIEFPGSIPGQSTQPALGIGDLNGDGKLDVVTTGTVNNNSVLSVFLQK